LNLLAKRISLRRATCQMQTSELQVFQADVGMSQQIRLMVSGPEQLG